MIVEMCILSVSIVINLVLGLLLIRRSRRKLAPLANDARQLLHDLTDGSTLLKIEVVSPMDVFIRRNRE